MSVLIRTAAPRIVSPSVRTQSRLNSTFSAPTGRPSALQVLRRGNLKQNAVLSLVQRRGIVAESITTAVVIHAKALGAGAACVGLAGTVSHSVVIPSTDESFQAPV